jgi:hypothetical protein
MKSKGCKQLHDPHPHPKEKIRTTNPTKKNKIAETHYSEI